MSERSPEMIVKLQQAFPAEYPMALSNQMTLKISDVDWSSYKHKYLVCKNHPMTRYLSKDPYTRSLHFLQGPNGLPAGVDEECDCSFSDLRVFCTID